MKVLPGDSLVKLGGHDAESAKRLVARMEQVAMRADGDSGPPETRARARARETTENGTVSAVTRSAAAPARTSRMLTIGKEPRDSVFDTQPSFCLKL